MSWSFKSNFDSIKNAYMLIYEREYKVPLKFLVSEEKAKQQPNVNIIEIKPGEKWWKPGLESKQEEKKLAEEEIKDLKEVEDKKDIKETTPTTEATKAKDEVHLSPLECENTASSRVLDDHSPVAKQSDYMDNIKPNTFLFDTEKKEYYQLIDFYALIQNNFIPPQIIKVYIYIYSLYIFLECLGRQ